MTLEARGIMGPKDMSRDKISCIQRIQSASGDSWTESPTLGFPPVATFDRVSFAR